MARLSESDKAALREGDRWAEPAERRSPRVLESTPQARTRYCRWDAEAAKFHQGRKPVRFTGKQWKL